MSAITISQQKRFWCAFSAACTNLGLSTRDEKEAYRKRILKDEGGVLHLGDLSRTEGYDKVMGRLAMDAGNYEEAVKFADSTAYRLLVVLEAKAKSAVGSSWEPYVQGIMARSGIGASRSSLKDLTEPEIRGLIAIVDTYLRRQRKASPPS